MIPFSVVFVIWAVVFFFALQAAAEQAGADD